MASNGVIVLKNQYDYMSRRIMKSTATATNTYLYDGWNMISEHIGAATPSSRYYVWGLDLSQTLQGAGGVGGLLSVTRHDAPGTTHYAVAYDANGNITEYVDTSDGAIAAHYEYDPFGNVSTQSGAMANDFVYRFSSKYTDDETGLVYYGYRFYNAELGRWVNRDPIKEWGGLNLYALVKNNPVSNYDYLGLTLSDYDLPNLHNIDPANPDARTFGGDGECPEGESWHIVKTLTIYHLHVISIPGEPDPVIGDPLPTPGPPGTPPGLPGMPRIPDRTLILLWTWMECMCPCELYPDPIIWETNVFRYEYITYYCAD